MNQQHLEVDTTKAYELIRDMVVSKELSPGEKIIQSKLSQELGVSRTPVVKALHRLSAEGLVDNIPNRGFYTHVLNIIELYELLVVRSGLDGIVAQNVAEIRTEAQAQELTALWEPFSHLKSPEQFNSPEVMKEYAKVDRTFHEMQYSMCSIGVLKKLNESNQILNRTFTCGLVRSAYETYTEHMRICEAISRNKPDAAFDAAFLHNSNTVKNLKAFIAQMRTMGLDPDKVTFNALQSGCLSGNIAG